MVQLYRYTDKEIDDILKSIVILIDTREQENQHIIKYFEQKKINYKNLKLNYGDYSFYIPANKEYGIDKKADLRGCFDKEQLQSIKSMEMLVSGLVDCGWDYSKIKSFIEQTNTKSIAN